MRHAEHVKNVGSHCQSEETTKQALILPFLNLLDFNPFDPLKVKAEYCADLPGIKNNERAGLEIGASNSVILNRLENLMKLSGIIFDALMFCQDDSNFKRKGQEAEGQFAAV
jgi:hypothetical protein